MAGYILQYKIRGTADQWSDSWTQDARWTEAEALAKARKLSDGDPYRIITRELVETVVEATPFWEEGKVYRRDSSGFNNHYRVTAVDESGYAIALNVECPAERFVLYPHERSGYVEVGA